MKNRNTFLSICTFSICLFGFSQNDQRARLLMNQLSETYATFESMYIEFEYVLDNRKEGISQQEKGVLLVADDKYILTIMGIQQLYNGTSIYTIDDLNEEVTIQEGVTGDSPINPLDMFDFYKEGYLLQWDISQNVSGMKIQYVKLIPTDPESQTKYLLLGINTTNNELYKIIDLGINGTDTTLTIKEFVANSSIAPNTFVFDESKYSNYYIDSF